MTYPLTIHLPDVVFGRCPACPGAMPVAHTIKFEDPSTYYCRGGDRQVRRDAIELRPVDAVARRQQTAEIDGEIIASAGAEVVILLALREVLRHVNGDYAIAEAIDWLVTFQDDREA